MRNKATLITGGATGIGKRTAFMLAAKGIDLVINYRGSQKEAVSLCGELSGKYGTRNIALQGDISITDDCVMMAEVALNEFPVIDILIHNAGPYVHERKEMLDYTFEQWNYLINGNLNAVFYLSKLFIPKMRETGWGRIITIGFDRVEYSSGWVYRSAFAICQNRSLRH